MSKRTNVHYQLSISARLEIIPHTDCNSIQFLEKDELFELQKRLQLGNQWGVISSPKEWLAPGGMKGAPNVHLTSACNMASSQAERDFVILTGTRLAILLFLVPVFGRRERTLLSISTILCYLRATLPMLRLALARPGANLNPLFARLTAADLTGMLGAKTKAVVLDHLRNYADQGYWSDIVMLQKKTRAKAPRSATARHPKNSLTRQWMPLPDSFVAAAGWRLIWVTKTLAPSVVKCVLALSAVIEKWSRGRKGKKSTLKWQRFALMESFFETYMWVDYEGTPILDFPFDYERKKTRKLDFHWRPACISDLRNLLLLVQSAHMFLLLLCTGPRASEAIGLERAGVVPEPVGNGIVNGAEFKPSFADSGRMRDWPLPPLVELALKQQLEVCNAFDALKPDSDLASAKWRGGTSLFVSPATGAAFGGNYNETLRRVITYLKLDDELDARGLHVHRFRKTLARLGALAIVGAPKILMDLFGHENVETTLGYMLSDPALHVEIQEMRRAEVIMLAETAIRSSERNGGAAAARIAAAVENERVRLGKDFGEESIRSMAMTFTMAGKIFQLVRPGVICTKTALQSGPCNKHVARPEPSRCNSQCEHRLELAALRDDVNQSITDAVGYFDLAEKAEDYFETELWEGQIMQNLHRFPDVAANWMTNATVSRIIQKNKGTKNAS